MFTNHSLAKDPRWYVLCNVKKCLIFLDYRTQIKDEKADVVTMQIIFNHAWYQSLDISPPSLERTIFLITKYPGNKNKFQTIIEPFEMIVWIFLSFSVISVCMVLVLLVQFDEKRNFDMFTECTIVIGVIINESLNAKLLSLDSKPSRQWLLVIWIPCSCLLGFAYQSNLRAFMMKAGREKPIDTFQDLMDRGITMHLADKTLVPFMVRTSPIKIIREAFQENTLNRNGLYLLEDGETPEYVFDEASKGTGVLESIASRFPGWRHLYRKGKHLDLFRFFCTYYQSMNHPILQKANFYQRSLVENGIFAKMYDVNSWSRSITEREHERSTPPEEKWIPISNNHLISTFIFSLCFLILALACFICELIAHCTQVFA